MKEITTQLVSKGELWDTLRNWYVSFYDITSNRTLSLIQNQFNHYFNEVRDELCFIVEYPYVDKLYRDSYYHYYSSKTSSYSRDSIRISVFEPNLNDGNQFHVDVLMDNYLGFVVLRPTFPNVIGRNVINPIAFKNDEIHICSVNLDSTANFLKVKATGFPHSTQDAETISCAETTLWSIVEYFSGRYSNYLPLLPSEIHKILSHFSFERQIPSKGLQAAQISYALKKIGFGVKMYSRNAFGDEFERNLRVYLESGLPLVALVQNSNVGHALNIVGRKSYSADQFEAVAVEDWGYNCRVKDIANCDTAIVTVDDNYPPYRIGNISNPVSYYSSDLWRGCTITNFIVPLYPKIYMEAGEARHVSKELIRLSRVYSDRSIAIRTFLTSSRSYKEYLLKLQHIDIDVKKLLLSLSMPKFVWITEIYDEAQFLNGQCEGIIIWDATEPKHSNLIGAIMGTNFIRKNNISNYQVLSLGQTVFNSFNNLKYYGTN